MERLKGLKVKNQYNQTVTIKEIIGTSVRVLEENNFYHITKLFYQGKTLSDINCEEFQMIL